MRSPPIMQDVFAISEGVEYGSLPKTSTKSDASFRQTTQRSALQQIGSDACAKRVRRCSSYEVSCWRSLSGTTNRWHSTSSSTRHSSAGSTQRSDSLDSQARWSDISAT
ncbi:hypothetical protein OESDEN_23282 [Oesophagostomum dentatum]|uniref:Uncharacterized protein n=1 Tax=Oesophagostomum dentatum TaxID=61180 RepID=A0A0B1RVH9_OESDE|nr:hypothetical protein OESDEN_23282 [Oesophagostomum dentatum]